MKKSASLKKWGKCEACYWNEFNTPWLRGTCPLKGFLADAEKISKKAKCGYFRPLKITRIPK